MREEILKRFFAGEVSAAKLAKDVGGSERRVNKIETVIKIKDMGEEFAVTRPKLISLCDAVLSGELPPQALATIGFALEASDRFIWDGDEDDLLANVIADWSCPEVNYPLTLENVGKFRAWLSGKEPYPGKAAGASGGKLVSIRRKG